VAQVTRAGATLLALIAVSALASCGGSDGSMQATLTDRDCTYEGDTTPSTGSFSIELENRTLRFASFGLVTLFEGESVEDIDPLAERMSSRQLARSRARSDVPPPFGRWVVGADVEPSSSTSLPIDTSTGRYVVVCYLHSNSEEQLSTDDIPRPARAYTVAQLDVTGARSYPGVND